MRISHQFFSNIFLDLHVNTPPSLKEQALTKLAIQVCQYYEVKKHIICASESLRKAAFSSTAWEDFLEKQSSAACEKIFLPTALKAHLIIRIRSVAIEILIWNKKYQVMLNTSPQDADRFLTTSDWTAEGRINEEKVAIRLVQDERIAVCFRYKIACVNCLEPFISPLWNQIPPKFREDCCCSFNKGCIKHSILVKFWSDHMTERYMKLGKAIFFQKVFEAVVHEGERTAVIYCWKVLREMRKEEVLMSAARIALFEYNVRNLEFWMLHLIQTDKWRAPLAHYSDILYFLLSQMSEIQKASFFKASLKQWGLFCVADPVSKSKETFPCFIDSPYRNYFIPIIIKMWEVLPEIDYGAILLILAERYLNIRNVKEYQVFDYGDLLLELLEKTPENYKRYIFADKLQRPGPKKKNEGKEILLNVLKKQPFERRNIEIMHDILQHATMEEKQSIIYSQCGRELCKILIENKYKETVDLILAECLSEEEIFDFKKKFMRTCEMTCYSFEILERENEESLISLLYWGCFTIEEIINFKFILTHASDCRQEIKNLVVNFQTDRVDRVLEWCLASEVAREQFKKQLLREYALDIFTSMILSTFWEEFTRVITWAFPTKEDLNNFKRELFDKGCCASILKYLALHDKWRDPNMFIQWCGLSPEEIKKIKKDVMFSGEILRHILLELFYTRLQTNSDYQEWGLSDAETVMAFKKAFEEFAFADKLFIQERLDKLIIDRLNALASSEIDGALQVA